ncbi:hypothetical protein KEJ40_06465 [Candidatus Bathyarchaeota archaeon]|nr:hypothetical protein [Candidatus Bathyarchaeota archaeon]
MKILIKIKPLMIKIPSEREEIYRRLKTGFEKAERIANDNRVRVKIRLEALRLAAYIAQVMLGALKDTEIEEIEREIEKLEEEVKNTKR